MQGLYLYCIRNKKNNEKLKVAGIDGGKVFAIPYKDIEAVVSNIDVQKFNTKEIARKAKEDLKWIIAQSEIHERVTEQAMGLKLKKSEILNLKSEIRAVIPMKFGTIFKDKKNLEQILQKNSKKFKNVLRKLNGKEEWGVKVYVDEKRLSDELKNKDRAVKAKIKGAKRLPQGADYFQELEVEDLIGKRIQQEVDKQGKFFFKSFKLAAYDARENKILAKEFAGKNNPMVLNSAYLIHKKSVKDFQKKVDELKSRNPAFIFECTGPWPPYNFV